jgi:hypothetical protein
LPLDEFEDLLTLAPRNDFFLAVVVFLDGDSVVLPPNFRVPIPSIWLYLDWHFRPAYSRDSGAKKWWRFEKMSGQQPQLEE